LKQPVLEKIEPGFGSSFTIRKFTKPQTFDYSTWHFHPEFELVYISSGSGKRHIGNHVSYYKDGDLIMLGPNLPHLCFTDGLMEEHIEIVVQMKPDFLGTSFFEIPEMQGVKNLFERSREGLSFSGDTKKIVGRCLQEIEALKGPKRLIMLLSILNDLAESEEYVILNAGGYALEVDAQEEKRIGVIYQYVQEGFKEEIVLGDAASSVNMTVPAFCRYFKKMTNKTFIAFVNEYRIAHACKLLAERDLTITEVCFESGFNNLSHFNKKFKSFTKESPTSYRKQLKKIVGE